VRGPAKIVVHADAGHTTGYATVVVDWHTARGNGTVELQVEARMGAVTAWCGFCGKPADTAPGTVRTCCATARMFTTPVTGEWRQP
jgi:hypothetical protein